MIGKPQNRFQQGSLIRVKNKTTEDTWVLRFYEDVMGRRVYRKQRIGTVRELPHRRDAERAVHILRANLNVASGARTPETVLDLVAHYKANELTEESGKRSSTREVYAGYLKVQIEPKWGGLRLDQVKAIEVEKWLRSLDYAPATKTKIRNIMSAVFNHAKRHGMIPTNPIQGVRCSSKRRREPDILTPLEFRSLLAELPHFARVMVLLAGTTGLRRSELIALKWKDVDFESCQIDVNKSCVRAQLGETKTLASARPASIHPSVAHALKEWQKSSLYSAVDDFLFPSLRERGAIPVWPDMVLQKIIRPAANRAGIAGKKIGWHSFRHSLGTNCRSRGVDIKIAQEILRHSDPGITLRLYTQTISEQKRRESDRVVGWMLGLET
jgi:integrase